ncbi:ribosomal protein S18-alanine N-acetyltransferase [Alicyclobacillus sp.]|uniref:ribosomal protein S18-alanine N-acetyltransferase n=1 Tax=Alicyclobacillus sp. TaxID=61169 RepID=UPI0025C1EEE1|nr:ribosomal protein S18-alanine N-acetyltransferase [Alicyclobacillus sp.]MCL6517492.1 ribosomal protein S18-alanine N-acetyltransferase [Alicyclobacillus sp.]
MAMAEAWDPEAVVLRPMQVRDLDEVLRIEKRCFTAPWSRHAFLTELVENQFAHYTVAEYRGRLAGYAGVWLILDEGHVTNIAVDPDFRGRHLGERLLRHLMAQCAARGITRMTLEVRVSNTVAQNLYRKLGFVGVGVRKGYYTDNQEDALIMWVDLPEPAGGTGA